MAVRTIGVAIAVPEPYGSELQSYRESFGDPLAAAIPAHVTLVPPLEVSAQRLEAVEDYLAGVAAEGVPFRMYLHGTGTFRPVSPVVFVQVADGISECERLESRLRAGPLDREVRFNYHPHVTVAHELADELLDHAFTKLATYEAAFEVTGFSLYVHDTDGVWRPLRRFPFGAAT
jgi:2'-5' RNA ligase